MLDLEGKAAEAALLKGDADAIFVMGDSATRETMRELLHTSGVRLFDFVQGDGYVRRFRYLTKIELPPGSIDLGKNTPAEMLTMVAPTVELVARSDLHPALSDVLIEAAREVHGRATLLQKAGEFPAPLEHEYRVSDDAIRYYKSGKSFAYKHLPFWVASLVDRALVLLVPIAVLLIPGLRIVPLLYRWRISGRIYRRYGELMALGRTFSSASTRSRSGSSPSSCRVRSLTRCMCCGSTFTSCATGSCKVEATERQIARRRCSAVPQPQKWLAGARSPTPEPVPSIA